MTGSPTPKPAPPLHVPGTIPIDQFQSLVQPQKTFASPVPGMSPGDVAFNFEQSNNKQHQDLLNASTKGGAQRRRTRRRRRQRGGYLAGPTTKSNVVTVPQPAPGGGLKWAAPGGNELAKSVNSHLLAMKQHASVLGACTSGKSCAPLPIADVDHSGGRRRSRTKFRRRRGGARARSVGHRKSRRRQQTMVRRVRSAPSRKSKVSAKSYRQHTALVQRLRSRRISPAGKRHVLRLARAAGLERTKTYRDALQAHVARNRRATATGRRLLGLG